MRFEKINIRLAAILENFRYQTRQGNTDRSVRSILRVVKPCKDKKTQSFGGIEQIFLFQHF